MSDKTKLILGLLVLIGTAALGYFQWTAMEDAKASTLGLNTEATTLTALQTSLINDYQELKVDATETREAALTEVEYVFPTEEKLTDLTRMFDDFATKNNFSSNPFFISSIKYSDLVEDENYQHVPLSLAVTTSKKNLLKFLEFVETSGSLESETRLMSIEDMSINYPDEYGGEYSVEFKINAYFSQEI